MSKTSQIEMKNYFERLKKYRGKKIDVDYYQFGLPYSENLVLKGVNDYLDISVGFPGGKTVINFIGYGSVIRQISGKDGEILYKNGNVSEDEDFRKKTKKDLENLFQSTFGFKGFFVIESIASGKSTLRGSKSRKSWYSSLDNWPRKEFFR